MKKLVVKNLALLVFLLGHFYSFSQIRPSAKDYSTSELKFMMKNGFDHKSYTWQNQQINLLLKDAIAEKRGTNSIVGIGVVVGLSLFALGVRNGYLSLAGTRPGTKVHSSTLPLILAGAGAFSVAVLIGGSKKYRAKQKIWGANRVRLGKPVISRYEDFFKKDG